jgi:hypothetical protein
LSVESCFENKSTAANENISDIPAAGAQAFLRARLLEWEIT